MAFTQTSDTQVRDNVLTLGMSAFIKERMFNQVISGSALLQWMAGGDVMEIRENQLMADLPPETLDEKTALVPLSGSRIEILLEMGRNDTVKWVTPWEAVDVENQELYTRAYFDWKNIMGSVVLSEIEEAMTDDEAVIDKMATAQVRSLKQAMVYQLQSAVFLDGSSNSGKAATGLQAFVAADPTTGTVGGINRANNAAWRNKQTAMGGALTVAKMRTVYHNCSLGNSVETPQFIITTQAAFEGYEAFLSTPERIVQNKRLANLDFEHYLFKNKCVVTWDGNCPAQSMYFLSKKGFKWAFNPKLNFKMRTFAYKPGTMVKEAPVVFQCEFVPVEPRRLGVLTGITNS